MKKLQISLAAPSRLDLALLGELRQELPSLSRARLKELFKQSRVLIQGKPASPSSVLPSGQIEVMIIDWDPKIGKSPVASPSPQGCFLPVVYEDEDLLVLNKASGIPSVPHSEDETETAVGAALARLPALAEVTQGSRPSELEPGLLHRLDSDTSGLIVFAKSLEEWERLHQEWKGGGVRKIYRAVAKAKSPDRSDEDLKTPMTVGWPLAHDPKSTKKMIALKLESDIAKGNFRGSPLPALTIIHSQRPLGKSEADFEVEIRTGVMHQIRCHFSALGWPLMGDNLYKGAAAPRLWLHAWRLVLPLKNQTRLTLQARLPEDWPKATAS